MFQCFKYVCSFSVTSIPSKVINDFVDLGKIFECGFEGFEKRKMLITFDRMMAQKG